MARSGRFPPVFHARGLRRLHHLFIVQHPNAHLRRSRGMVQGEANVVLSLVLCLAGVWLGHVLAMELNTMKGS